MPIRFENYRFTSRTPLSDETFNSVHRDLDIRLADLEAVRIEWEVIVDQLTAEGLRKLNEALLPAYVDIQAMRDAAEDEKAVLDALYAQAQIDITDYLDGIKALADGLLAQIPDAITRPTLETELDAALAPYRAVLASRFI